MNNQKMWYLGSNPPPSNSGIFNVHADSGPTKCDVILVVTGILSGVGI